MAVRVTPKLARTTLDLVEKRQVAVALRNLAAARKRPNIVFAFWTAIPIRERFFQGRPSGEQALERGKALPQN